MNALKEKNEAIADLDKKIQEANHAKSTAEESLKNANSHLAEVRGQYQATQGALVNAQHEVHSLTEARNKLNEDIKNLKQETKELERGLAVMRGGQMMYGSGEVVFTGVLQAGRSEEENLKQVKWLLDSANTAAMNRINLDPGSKANLVWVPEEESVRLLQILNKAKGNVLVRMRSLANTVVGQPVLCAIEAIPNRLIFKNGEKIHQKQLNLDEKDKNPDQLFVEFLKEVNERSVKAGVLPDPLTGKVGNMSAVTMVETVNKMQRMGGKLLLTAYADGEITTAGPVQLRLKLERQ